LQDEPQLLCWLARLIKDRIALLVFVVLALEADPPVIATLFTVTKLEQTRQVVCLFDWASIVNESLSSALDNQLFALLLFGHDSIPPFLIE
jgi:hypothetical protein